MGQKLGPSVWLWDLRLQLWPGLTRSLFGGRGESRVGEGWAIWVTVEVLGLRQESWCISLHPGLKHSGGFVIACYHPSECPSPTPGQPEVSPKCLTKLISG